MKAFFSDNTAALSFFYSNYAH